MKGIGIDASIGKFGAVLDEVLIIPSLEWLALLIGESLQTGSKEVWPTIVEIGGGIGEWREHIVQTCKVKLTGRLNPTGDGRVG